MAIAEFSMAVACDAILGAVTIGAANAAASNTGKVLKAVELQLKYGPKRSGEEVLQLP